MDIESLLEEKKNLETAPIVIKAPEVGIDLLAVADARIANLEEELGKLGTMGL